MTSVCYCGSVKSFIHKRRLPKTIPTSILKEVLEKTKLTQQEILPIYANFRNLAPYGVMTFSKFKGTMGILGMLDDLFLSLSMFHAFDKDNNGELNFVEFATALGIMVRGNDNEKLELSFRIICPKFRDTTQHLGYTYQAELEPKQKKKIAVDTIIYQAPVINFTQFYFVVTSLDRTRRQLVSAEQSMLQQEQITEVFRQVAKTKIASGSYVISLSDFKQAVRTNPEFLVLLGVFPGTLDNQLSFAPRSISSPLQLSSPDESPFYSSFSFKQKKSSLRNKVSGISAGVSSHSNTALSSVIPLEKEKHSAFDTEALKKPRSSSLYGHQGVPLRSNTAFSPDSRQLTAPLDSSGITRRTCPFTFHNPPKEHIAARSGNMDMESPSSIPSERVVANSSPKPLEKILSPPLAAAIEKHELMNLKLHLYDLLEEMRTKYEEMLNFRTICVESASSPPVAHDMAKPSDNQSEMMLSALSELSRSPQSSQFIRTIKTLTSLKPHHESPPLNHTTNVCDEKALSNLLSGLTTLSQLAPPRNVSSQNKPVIESPKHSPPHQDLPCDVVSLNNTNKLILFFETNWRHIESKIEDLISRLELRLYCLESNQQRIYSSPSGLAKVSLKEHESYPLNQKSGVYPVSRDNLIQQGIGSQMSIGGGSRQPLLKQMTTSRRMYMNRPNFEQYKRQRRHGSIATLQQRIQRRRVEYKLLGPYKGFAVHFGHPSWNTVLVMMVGIRMAAGSITLETPRSVTPNDFKTKKRINIMPRTTVPPDVSPQRGFLDTFWFIDYAPVVFRNIRELFGITADSYLHSIGPEQLVGNMVLGNLVSLSELCTEGKSGSFFYYTADGRFLIKTITRASAKFFESILKDYYDHLFEYPNTLIARFYGYHAMQLKRPGSTRIKLHFIIMGNVFHTPVEIHRRYDLKGSWVGRSSGTAAATDPTIAMKDADLVSQGEKIVVGPEQREILIRLIELDAEFFKKHLILDYSLLVGIHYVNYFSEEDIVIPNERQSSGGVAPSEIDYLRQRGEILGNLPPYPAKERDIEGVLSADKQKTFYFGIIDILTRWTALKRVEHAAKSVQYGKGEGVSCIHPTIYANRFVDFLRKHIE